MKTIIVSIACVLVLFVGNINAQNVDTDSSYVSFEVDNFKVNTVEGTFSGLQGTIDFSQNNLGSSSFNVCLDASSINTGNKKRDKDLRGDKFFDVENYPKICFDSKNISAKEDSFVAVGDLTIRDVTKEVEIPFNKTGMNYDGKLTIMRKDYDVGANVGAFKVGEEITIFIHCKEN